MKPVISAQVLRGTPGFADACRVAAATLAMVACANATASADRAFERAALPATAASSQLKSFLAEPKALPEPLSAEQSQTLAYGVYPPVKTSVLIKGKLQTHWTLHPFDLVRLSREAAQKASAIEGVKVDPAKVGALMMTESSLLARTGWSSNGKTPSFGLGQLELNTAKSLGVQNPNDPRESALAVARLLAQGQRFARANPSVDENIAISLAYNTSTALRKSLVSQYGSALGLQHIPQATQHHVKNMIYCVQRMAVFARLNDQHDKSAQKMHAAVSHASTTSYQPKEIVLNTSHTPAPSTKALISSLSTDGANQVRLKYNQIMLEKDGHIQTVPMTSRGLNDLRLAVSTQTERLGQANTPASLRHVADDISASMIFAKAGTDIAALARSLIDKVRISFAQIAEYRESIQKHLVKADSPGGVTAKSALFVAGGIAGYHMRMAALQMNQLRERIMAQREQQSPTA